MKSVPGSLPSRRRDRVRDREQQEEEESSNWSQITNTDKQFNVNDGESVVSVTKLSLAEEDEQIAGDEPKKDVENFKNNNSNEEIEVAESDQENTDTNNGEES